MSKKTGVKLRIACNDESKNKSMFGVLREWEAPVKKVRTQFLKLGPSEGGFNMLGAICSGSNERQTGKRQDLND